MQNDTNLVQDSKAAVLAALEEIGSTHGADFVSIWPFTEDENKPVMRRQYLWCRTALSSPQPLPIQHNSILDNKNIHGCLMSNIPIADASSAYPDIRPVISPMTQTFVMIPLILNQHLWGVIICEFPHPQPFLAQELTTLMESAVHIAAVLQRKQDIERMSAAYQEYRSLLEKPGTWPAAEDTSTLLLDKLPEGVFTLNAVHRITYLSPFFSRFKRFSREMFQEKIFRAMQAEFFNGLGPDDDALINKQRLFTIQLETLEQEPLVFEVYAAPLNDADGAYNGSVCIARDITRRYLTEQKKSSRENQFRHLIENINDVICSYDSRGAITFVSENIKRIFGYTASEVTGKPAANFMHPDFLPLWEGHLEKLRYAQADVFECRLRYQDGSYHWVRMNCRPVLDNEGHPRETVSLMVNIDAYKEIEQNFQESEQAENVYQQIIEQMPSLVWVVDTQLITTYVSPSIGQVLGYTQEEALGMEMGLILKRGSFKHMIEAFDEALFAAKAKDKTWFKDLEIWQKRANGRIIKGSLRMSLLFNEDQHIGILGITTMRKKAGKSTMS